MEITMKFKLIFGALVFGFCTYTYAGCVGQVINGKCVGTYIDNPNVGTNSNNSSGYKSSSGTRYQYDQSNPSDSLRYSTDLDAQRRDQMNLNLNRGQDRSTGQLGGGIYND